MEQILKEGDGTIVLRSSIGKNLVVVELKNDMVINGNAVQGIGLYSAQTAVSCFSLLNRHSVATHFLPQRGGRRFRALRMEMTPYMLGVTRVGTALLALRQPHIPVGEFLNKPVLELFNANGSRFLHGNPSSATLQEFDTNVPVSNGPVAKRQIDPVKFAKVTQAMFALGLKAFHALQDAWLRHHDTKLVNLFLRFGYYEDELRIGGVITHDSWTLQRGTATVGKQVEDYRWAAKAAAKFTEVN